MLGCTNSTCREDSLAILLNLARIMSERPGTRAQESLLPSLSEREISRRVVIKFFIFSVKQNTRLNFITPILGQYLPYTAIMIVTIWNIVFEMSKANRQGVNLQ